MTSITDILNWFSFSNNDENNENPNKKDKYTYSTQPTPLQKSHDQSAQKYKQHMPSSIQQGADFINYQNRIQNGLTKQVRFVTEGFGSIGTNSSSSGQSNSSSSNSLSQQTQSILNTTTIPNTDEETNNETLNEYNNTLSAIQKIQNQIQTRTQDAVQRMNPSNPYLGKNIVFSTGEIAYVTNKGVVKVYLNNNIFNNTGGKNGCPSLYTNVNIPWEKNYLFPGVIIPTTPPLISGTPMKPGQSCGNEGNNVLISQTVSDPSSSYVGCYRDKNQTPAMPTLMNGGSKTYTNATCLQAAIDSSYSYYGLQQFDSTTGLAKCYLSNDLVQSEQYGLMGNSTVCSQESDGYIYGGSLLNAIYQTPTANYIGAYSDDGSANTMTMLNNGSQTFSYSECYNKAISKGSTYFGLQNYDTSTEKAACGVSSDFNQITQNGTSNKTIKGKGNYIYGKSLVNAVYQVAQNAPYKGCFNDESSTPAMTAVDNASATYSYDTCQQYAQQNAFTYFALQGVTTATDSSGNPQAQCWVSNSKTEAEQYGTAKSCSTSTNDGYTYGNGNVNAIYSVSQNGNPSLVGQFGFINQDGLTSTYPSSMYQFDTSNNYTKMKNYDSSGNDINNSSYGNATSKDCANTCSGMTDCYGYVFDTSTNTCYPKNSGIFPKGQRYPNNNRNLFLRNSVLNSGTPATNQKLVDIDSISWMNYIGTGQSVPDTSNNIFDFFGAGVKEPFTNSSNTNSNTNANSNTNTNSNTNSNTNLSKNTNANTNTNSNTNSNSNANSNVQNQILTDLENRLKMLSQQITNNSSTYANNNQTVNQQSTVIQPTVQQYMNEYTKINKKIGSFGSVENILNETDIVVLQENYNYLLSSILVIGATIVTLKVANS